MLRSSVGGCNIIAKECHKKKKNPYMHFCNFVVLLQWEEKIIYFCARTYNTDR